MRPMVMASMTLPASNVEEWCADWYHADYYKESLVKNPPGPDTGSIDVWGPDSG